MSSKSTTAFMYAALLWASASGLSIVGPRLLPQSDLLRSLAPVDLLSGTGLEELEVQDVWVENNIPLLQADGDFGLSCDANGNYTLSYDPDLYNALDITRELLSEPLWVDQGFNTTCVALEGQSFLGPLATMPDDIQQYVSSDEVASSVILKPLHVNDGVNGNLVFSAAIGDYHDVIGTLNHTSADPSQAFLEDGVYPWDSGSGANDTTSRDGRSEKRSLILTGFGVAVGLTNLGCRIANGCVAGR